MSAKAASSANALVESLPDLTALLGRNGTVIDAVGGTALPALPSAQETIGRPMAKVWPAPLAEVVARLLRHSLAGRCPLEGVARLDRIYEVRLVPRGPAHATCTIRAALELPGSAESAAEPAPARAFDRRGFRRRFRESVATAALQERPLAVAAIHVDGLAEIVDTIGTEVFERVRDAAVCRLDTLVDLGHELDWYLGPLDDSTWIAVVHSADRTVLQAWAAAVVRSLSEPVVHGDARFHLVPHAGVAVLGKDGSGVDALLNQARTAAEEARRSAVPDVRFSSDTLRVRSLARLDVARELREAIDGGAIRLRYASRHEFATGRLVARLGYLRWPHPLRGDVRPAEFLQVAEATGQSVALSRTALRRLADDIASFPRTAGPMPCCSFGPLRHHVLHAAFGDDIESFLAASALQPSQLELRIAERTYITCPSQVWERLADIGVRLIIDECGRLHASLERMARAALSGLQLDRSWVARLPDPTAVKVCRAMIGLAHAFDIVPMATGVDDEARRDALLTLGCREGSGDLFASAVDALPHGRRASGPT